MATPFAPANPPIQPLGLVGETVQPVPNIETRTEEQYFQDVTTPTGTKPVSPDAATPVQSDPFAGFQDAGFDQFQDAPDEFAAFSNADDLDLKSVEELDKDRDNFRPADYFSNNPDVARDPKKLAKLLEIYRRRDEEGLTAKGVASAAVTNTPGLVADIGGGIKRLGERAIDLTVQPVVNVLGSVLTGDIFDDSKRAAFFNEAKKSIKKGGAEVGAGSEAATVGLVDLARTGEQKLSSAFTPVPLSAMGEVQTSPEAIPLRKPKTDQELLAQLSDDASFRQTADAAMRGEGEAAKNFGLDKETLAKQGIELDEKAIQQLSLVDPITMVATGGAFKLVGLGGKVLGAARTLEGAQYLADGLAKVAKFSAGKGIQYAGTATKYAGTVLQGSGRSAALITGIGAATRGAGPVEALAIAGATKLVGPTVRKVGALAEHFGKSITGEVPVSVAGQKLLDYAKPVIEAGKTVGKGFLEGMAAGAPFAVVAQDDETAGSLLGAGGALGATGAAGAGAFRVVKSSASRRYFGENRPVLPDVASPGYGKDVALDAQHEANIQKLSAQDASELNNFREALRQQGGEIYAVDANTFRQKMTEIFPGITPEQLDTYANHSAFFDQNLGDRKVVYLNSDTTGLQHDAGHIFDALLSPEKRMELRKAVTDTFGQKAIDDFKATYERKVGNKISDAAAKDEYIAEQYAAMFNNVPVTELNAPKSLLSKFIDVAAEGAEALGIDLTAGTTTPNLGAPVNIGIRQLFRNAAGDVTRRSIEAKTATPTNVSAPDFRGGGEGRTPPSGGAPTPASPNPPTGGPANAVPLFPSRNTRVTPGETSRLGQPLQSPGAREAAAKRFSETGIDMARAKAKENEGSPNSRAIESISDSMESGNPVVQIEHLGVTSKSTPEAPLGDVARSAEQSAAYPKISSEASRVGVPADIISQHSKNFVPVRWFQNKKGKLKLLAMSLDKVITNIKIVSEAGAKNPKIAELIPYPTENGRLTEEGWRQATADAQSYSENQANGRMGDGNKLIVPEAGLSVPAQNPSYTPRMLTPEKANFHNLLQGIETPLTSGRGSKETGLPANIKGQLFAEANLRPTETPARIEPKRANKQAFIEFPGRTVQEVNPLRNEFERQGFDHRNLLKVTEEINAKDIQSATPRPDINYKAPVTDVIRGGFLPRTTVELERNIREENLGAYKPTVNQPDLFFVVAKDPKGNVVGVSENLFPNIQSAVDSVPEFKANYKVPEGYFFHADNLDYNTYRERVTQRQEAGGTDSVSDFRNMDLSGVKGPSKEEVIQYWKDRNEDERIEAMSEEEYAQWEKEQKIEEVHAPGNFLPAPTEFRQKNLGGRTVEEFSDYILKASPTEWKAATDNMTGGLTGGAWNLGLGLKDAGDVGVLKAFQAKLSEATKAAMSSGDFDAAYSLVSKGQFFREAYEAATGTGSAGAAFKRGTAGMESAKPPFPATEKTQGTAAAGPETKPVNIGEAGQFLPRTESGKTLEKQGYKIRPFGELGVRGVEIFDRDNNRAGEIISEEVRPNEVSVNNVLVRPNFRGKGVGEALYRELAAQLKEDGVTTVVGDVVAPEPLALRRKVFGDFETLDVNGQPASIEDALTAANMTRKGVQFSHVEPTNRITPESQFLPAEQLDIGTSESSPPELRVLPAAPGGRPPTEPPGLRPPPVAAGFQPKTDSGRKLEEKGYEIVASGELGIRKVTIKDPDGADIAQIQSIQRSPKRAEIAFVNKVKGSPAGLGEVLYRELGAQLKEDGVTEVGGNVVSPEPLAIRRKVFGDFASLDLNGEPATFDQAIAASERIQARTENEVAAIEPVNTISEASRFLPKVKRDAQGRPLKKNGDIDYAKWQKEGLAARRKQEKEPIAESTPRGIVSKDAGPITGWILPDKNFVPLDTNFHEQFLAENAKDLNKRFGTSFSDAASAEDRLAALNAGFVRLRNQNGQLRVEVNARKFPSTKSKLMNVLQDRESQIDGLTMSLLNDKGVEVDSTSASRLHELTGPEKFDKISEAIDTLRSGRFLPEGVVSPGPKTESDPGFLYHATNRENAEGIAEGKMVPKRPWFGTNQSAWPDGETEKRSYFTPTAKHAYQFAPEEGQSVLLRHKKTEAFKRESTGDYFSTSPLPASGFEILTETGWVPLSKKTP